MKHYDKFYEVGNNRYYTLSADDSLYIGTESFLPIGKKRLFGKQKTLTQGFKLLEVSAPVAFLFNALDELEPKKTQKYDSDDIIEYDLIDIAELKNGIIHQYNTAVEQQLEEVDTYYKIKIENSQEESEKDRLRELCEKDRKAVSDSNPLNYIDLVNPIHTGCATIKSMLRSGLKHLYTSRVTAFASNVFLYEQDCFGQITIYRIMTIKNVIKSIDTFVYDKKLIKEFLKHVYEKEI